VLRLTRFALAAGLVFTAAGCGGDPLRGEGGSGRATVGTSAASCVETYSPKALRHRAFAFDGTAIAVEDRRDLRLPPGEDRVPWVTFEVNRWYLGGDAPQVGVWMEGVSTSRSTGSQDAFPVEPGARLLVAGEPRWGGSPLDDPIAWWCGFTRRWTAAAAAEWDLAFEV
jgi:hypothetical protein